MKKAVTLIRGFLKLPKLKQKDASNNEHGGKENTRRTSLPNCTTFKPCKRCILVYETTIWASLQRKLLLQEHDELTDNDAVEENQFKSTEFDSDADDTEMDAKIRGFFNFYGLLDSNLEEMPMLSNKSCMSTMCLAGHTFRWVVDKTRVEIPLGPHYPTFVFVCKAKEKRQIPFLYQDLDLILFRASMELLRSLLGYHPLPHELTMELNAEVWVVISKIRVCSVSLSVEDDLLYQYTDSIIWSVFFDIPKSRESREMHLEALFQAVDQIMDISLYITLTSGIPPENQSFIKDTIIETATVVTSTAAESTATVGIETAAMAMGQAAAGVALSVLVDVGITAGMVTRAKIRRDKGLITQKEFQKTVRYKLCDSGCQFIGGTAGTIVGQVLIPVPVVGAIVGGFCGSLLGAGVSKGIIKTSEIISKSQAAKLKAIKEK